MEQSESTQVQPGESILPNSTALISSSKHTVNMNCTACQKPLEGNWARALDGAFHWECFLCIVRI